MTPMRCVFCYAPAALDLRFGSDGVPALECRLCGTRITMRGAPAERIAHLQTLLDGLSMTTVDWSHLDGAAHAAARDFRDVLAPPREKAAPTPETPSHKPLPSSLKPQAPSPP